MAPLQLTGGSVVLALRPVNFSVVSRWLASGGIALYAMSFLLSAMEFGLFTTSSLQGYVVFFGTIGSITDTIDGEIVWFFIWLANPLFWLAYAFARRGQPDRAAIATTAAVIVLVTGALQIYEPRGIELIARDVPFSSSPPMYGAYAWAAGIALAGVGWAIRAVAN